MMNTQPNHSIGYTRHFSCWVKAIVMLREGAQLGIAYAPKVDTKLVHIDDFVSEEEYKRLAQIEEKQTESEEHKIQLYFRSKTIAIKKLIKSYSLRKFPCKNAEIIRGTHGWVKDESKYFNKRWRRGIVINISEHSYTISISPNLEQRNISKDNFLIENEIEPALSKLRFIDRLLLKKELLYFNIPYKYVKGAEIKFGSDDENDMINGDTQFQII